MDLRVQTLGHKKTLVKTRVFKWCPQADDYRTAVLEVTPYSRNLSGNPS